MIKVKCPYNNLNSLVIQRYKSDEGFTEEEEKRLPNDLLQRKFWLLFEYPESSFQAKIVAILSVYVIIISIITFCIETLPQFKFEDDNEDNPDISDTFYLVETICICWFSLEFFMRIGKRVPLNLKKTNYLCILLCLQLAALVKQNL